MAVSVREVPSGEVTARQARSARIERLALIATALLPAPLIVYLGVHSGGYPRGITGVAAGLVAALLVLRAVVAPRTVRRPGRIGLAMAGSLAALAAWQLLSAGWSDSAARAVAEFDRTALYLMVVLTFVTLPRDSLRPVLLAVGGGVAVLALMGLATRLQPDVFPTTLSNSPQRLSFPITYWNAMGVLIACGLVLCLHLAAEVKGPRLWRVLAAALFPALATTLYLTLSRGGLGAAAAGLILYALLAFPRGLVLAGLAIGVPTVLVLREAYAATALISDTPTSPEALVQGTELTSAVIVACCAAGIVRAVLTVFDRPLAEVRLPRAPVSARRLAWGGLAAALVAAALTAGVPGQVQTQYERFVRNTPTAPISDPRARLTQVYNAGRISHWDVALDASAGQRLKGLGAGTFDQQWYRLRPGPGLVTEAHNLYVETLSELGVVGLALLMTFLGSMLAAAVSRRTRRSAAAAIGAVTIAWALHAAIDWDWEVPAVTLVPIVLAAAAASVPAERSLGRRRWTPAVAAAGAVVLAVLPIVTALAETRTSEAQAAYDAGRCSLATARAEQARSLLPVRPEPYGILALCAARAGRGDDAVRLSGQAVDRDPGDWEWRYLDTLVIGASGGDPRSQLREARIRNPLGVAPNALTAVLEESPRRLWRRRSAEAFVFINGRAYQPIGRVQPGGGRIKG